ncbi:DUF6503 family protein [Polaribacter glomeratus]|uniref:Threonine synthase n=1 Tax=Polaribacter glomeratus TaxID=102 RepID=A0A2S7WUU9_9FLAO|nr:DUF6503 family protein [Polaribacter glomeratus]PQJ81355.1 hypothetical protein BTO16_01620 [Polaribacter glomeratus]TXD64847.1 hypothetical protein ESX12_13620 [Polaribacter glomeratus]
MKKIILLIVIATIVSCKNDAKPATQKEEIKKESFPDELAKVFEKHGGIATWRKAKTLSFNKGEEAHTSDLQSRKIVINSPKYSLGFDGKEIWLDQADSTAFKGNKDFYYNLYFYFYAMPFVLADDGIIYEKVDSISFDGTNYPGYKISFKANVGTSSDDNYKVYFNSETYQMEWLAYTVTFKAKEPNNEYHIIKYNKWENVDGLVLPNEITWYKMDKKGMPTKPQGPATVFTLPLVSEGKLGTSFFTKPNVQ